METIREKFAKLGVDNAPGQETRQKNTELPLKGENLLGKTVDFSHGDVDAFPPVETAFDYYCAGVKEGGSQAYTEYRGKKQIRQELAERLAEFTGAPIDAENEMILTPGTQGALFLAYGATVVPGTKVAIVEPDYFANRKLVHFLEGELYPVPMHYTEVTEGSGIDLEVLEDVFRQGVKVFQFSNPNNPTGVIYSEQELRKIAELAEKYEVTVIADELYSRQVFDGRKYIHLRELGVMDPSRLLTILGPSKTESLSGYRLGAAFGSAELISRMEKLQAIVSLRCAGYSQSVFHTWFREPEGWLENRVAQHQKIRDHIVKRFSETEGVSVRLPEGGSYVFPKIEGLSMNITDFVKILRKQANVTVTPGTEFGPQFTDCFRINFSQDPQAAFDAVERIIQMIERYRE